jgi:hypothetical protein
MKDDPTQEKPTCTIRVLINSGYEYEADRACPFVTERGYCDIMHRIGERLLDCEGSGGTKDTPERCPLRRGDIVVTARSFS